MNYLLFNNDILMSDGENVRRLKGADAAGVLGAMDAACLCVVDVDVLITPCVELPIEKKDSILVRKFKEFYQHEAYVIQDEKIDTNLFQVVGIKEQKVREVYSLIPSSKVVTFVPYAIVLRSILMKKGIDLNKTVVFVDGLGEERLLTVFDGLKFSRTRVIVHNGDDLLPEIKRSGIDFLKKTEEFLIKKTSDFVIIVNDQTLAAALAQNQDKIKVEYFDMMHPALEGLKEVPFATKWRLPEEDVKDAKDRQLKHALVTWTVSAGIFTVGLIFWVFQKIQWQAAHHQWRVLQAAQEGLDEQIKRLDQETYRQDLKRHSLNYGVAYLACLQIIPASYIIDSFKFYKTNQWHIEMTLLAEAGGGFEAIPRIKILKNAEIKDIFVNNQPAKHLAITL